MQQCQCRVVVVVVMHAAVARLASNEIIRPSIEQYFNELSLTLVNGIDCGKTLVVWYSYSQ